MFDLDRIKGIPILTVARDLGFTLSQSGGGRCRLPGHDDAEPSFSIRSSTNRFTCFGCDRRGSVIDLVALMLGLDFVEACRLLDQRYLGGDGARNAPKRSAMRRPSSASLVKPKVAPTGSKTVDAQVFEWLLAKSPLQPSGVDYLTSRGFSRATIEYFQVGQMRSRDVMLRTAAAEFGIERLLACGLVKPGRFGAQIVFPMNYLLFPFLTGSRVTYLQARRADGEKRWRWFNLADLPPPIFNANVLTQAVRTITLCEGVTDVLSAHELGLDAVGLLGASSSLDAQTAAGFRGRNLVVMGDADNAGRSFSKRMRDTFAALGLTVIRKRLPPECNDLNDHLLARRKHAHELA